MDFTDLFKELIFDEEKEFNLEISSFLISDDEDLVQSWSITNFVNVFGKPLLVSYFKSDVNLHELNRIKRDLVVNSKTSSSESKFTSKCF